MSETPSARFVPSRAGIVNLWDYRDEEFVFVNGWLVLRGPNGSGKTKALEVLFPFLLDGRIEPRRLNPFASEDRTMKSNLLYRGQDQAHAYVWMEFHHAATGEFVTIGIGLRAHRHVDKVTRHHFVVDGRVGVDFSLIDSDDRPLNRRALITELGADRVFDSADDYRHAVDGRLFGLGPARYEQLLDLVLTLRKPQLAKDLNPVELSRTLQRGLRPLDDALIIEAAGSFDDMEAVARTLEGLVSADQATSGFLAIYSTYLRTHARSAADALTARTAAAEHSRTTVVDTFAFRRTAEAAYAVASEAVVRAEGEPGRLRAHLERLKSSTAYQSHEQLADLKRHVDDLEAAAIRAHTAASREDASARSRQAELTGAQTHATDASSQLTRLIRSVADEAEDAGIGWTAEDAEDDGFATRAGGRITARRDDIRAVRERATQLASAERDHVKAAEVASAATAATADAEDAERAAEVTAAETRDAVRAAVATWATRYDTVLRDLDARHATDLLPAAVDRIGDPGSPSLREILSELLAPGITRTQRAIAAAETHRAALDERRTELTAERERIAAEHDDAPAATATRTADRADRPGAPLWRLVRFADDLPDDQAAAVEAALEAASLLDAWIHPDPAQTGAALTITEADGYLHPLPIARRPAGRTLRDLLTAEQQDTVPVDAIDAVLASISVHDTITPDLSDPTAISLAGQFTQGILLGSYTKVAPEFVGATARAIRRAARLGDCDRMIADLVIEIDVADQALRAMRRTIDAGADATRELPSPDPIHAALRHLESAATTARLRRETLSTAAAGLDQAIAEQSAAATALRRVSAERSLPPDRIDAVADALRRFESATSGVDGARRIVATAQAAVVSAQDRYTEALDRMTSATEDAHESDLRHEEKREELQTLTDAIDDTDVHRVLLEVAETEQREREAEAMVAQLRKDLTAADRDQTRAAERVDAAQAALSLAVIEARRESRNLRPFAHADLLGLLRCPTTLRWPAQLDDDPPDSALPDEVTALHDAILVATKELTPTENSLKQSSTRLNSALTELQSQLPAAGLDHRPEWENDDGVIIVRVADEQGLTPVAHFAERIARERQDQEQLLSDAERRILEDALLTQLARQIHQRTVESRDLVEGMDIQMRARRMSSGMTVGVGWHLSDDLDPEQREACKLLERDPARLVATQLTTLRRHFATRIKAARAMAPELPYRDLLAQVLDYRLWRTFKFTLHRPGGTVEQLTRGRHSQLSGGEQSVSLHLPLFAAANALFGSARANAPRMIGLDEAFAGVDENGRGELMALATQFDLDLFMTGYDLWAAHGAVTGAAHYDLSHSAIDNAVATVLLVWNGSATVADFDGTLARALGSPETRRVPGPGPSPVAEHDQFELEVG